jgi:NADH-quinone oxidoreductase subunit M
MSALLIFILLLPLIGAVLVIATSRSGIAAVRASALMTSVVTAVLAGVLVMNFPDDPQEAANYAATDVSWLAGSPTISPVTAPSIESLDVRFSVALDGLSLWLFFLSALLVVTCVLVSWNAIKDRPATFYALLLLLETGILGVFASQDIILFYVFFEFTLIPLFILIGVFGSEQRHYAAIKFFLYTFAGSVLTFLGLLATVLWCGSHNAGTLTFSIPELTNILTEHPMPLEMQLWIFAALFVGFAIKVPLFPFHTWLPLAHVQAPTAGSVLLAGVLLKIGTYGFVRFSMPMLPDASAAATPYLLWLAVAGILYGALVALAQTDIKKLIAYSSVSHLGYCMLGIFALNSLGMQGGVLQMINHGISTGALFALIGMIYERYHTREIAQLGGLAKRAPWMAFFMVLFTMSSIGLPGTNGFTGEFLILVGMFQRAWAGPIGEWTMHLRWIWVVAVVGVVLGAWYMLWLVQRVFFGPLKEPANAEHEEYQDLNGREIAALTPLAVLVVWIGLYPQMWLQQIAPAVVPVATNVAERFDEQNEMATADSATETPHEHKPETR